MSSTRPIITAGPMERNSNPFKSGSVAAFGTGGGGVAGVCACCASIRPAMAMPPTPNVKGKVRLFLVKASIVLPEGNYGVKSIEKVTQPWSGTGITGSDGDL